ncbi:MAG: cobalamin-dependent protein, partial [Candidatus Lokiarchaeota archaeon]|nr:cobalamin-dependent protein [Candidatus Lokiarchaeota archaeon]
SDMHDIGKNIVIFFLEAEGFEVIDLGVDVPPEKFVEVVRNEKPDILAISTLITLTMPEVSNTLKALENANLRNGVKIIVGGAPITQEFIDDIGADALAVNVIDGVKKCKRWVGV